MEEVDEIIFNSLTNIGCDFTEGLESLKQLSIENVVEATVRCLKIINPDFKMSHLLPPGMSARFRVGSAIAQACQSVGYRDNIGYQTFLYSSETDIRKIFMFLIEKLPRKEGTKEDEMSTSILKRRIGRVLRDQCATLWLPPYCSLHKSNYRFKTQSLNVPIGKQLENSDKLLYVHQQVSDHSLLSPSVLEMNISSLASHNAALAQKSQKKQESDKATSSLYQWKQSTCTSDDVLLSSSFDDVIQSLSGSSGRGKQSRFAKAKKLQFTDSNNFFRRDGLSSKPSIPAKPAHLKSRTGREKGETIVENSMESESDGKEKEERIEETEEERFVMEETEVKELLSRTEEAQIQYKDDISTLQTSIEQMKTEIEEVEKTMDDKRSKLELQKKTVYLLPNADESIAKLNSLIEKSSNRLVELGKMWEERRLPLVAEVEELEKKCSSSQFDAESKLEEIKELRKRMKETNDETKRKEQMIKQLTSELDSMKRDISRQSYTKRILEIVASIHKQKAEIERVIGDMRETQKQINQLKGRTDRTFTAVDDVMFRDTKKDENVRKAYKYLVALHDNCGNLIETVEDTGAILREIRELEEQIEIESKKNTESNLKNIMKDYKAMKKENIELMKQLKQG